MNLLALLTIRKNPLLKVSPLVIFLLILPIFTSYVFIRQSSLSNTENSLKSTISTVKKDLVYDNGKWEVDRYNADPSTPSPNSTNSSPLYIITTDGFVIERSRPIAGLLDFADFKHLLEFGVPQNITTPTNETWRIYSKSISLNGSIVGVITVSYYSPQADSYSEIDNALLFNAQKIYSEINIKKGALDISKFDNRSIPYYISYEIVTNLNEVLITNGRIPSFIDNSYVASELNAGERIIKDKVTSESFLVLSSEITDKKGFPVGVIVTARSISNLFLILNNFLIFSFLVNTFLTIPLVLVSVYIFRSEIISLLKNDTKNRIFKKISFDNHKSIITIGNNKITEIPYASNQYYLCKAVFSQPHKKWEVDELLEKFGEYELSGKARTVYDAMLAINKKLGIKIITYSDKTYKLNPELLSKL